MELSRRLRLSFVVAVAVGSLAATAVPQVALGISFAARASITPRQQFVGDSTGATYTLTVRNTGTVRTIGAVKITHPTSFWTVTACPHAPATWTVVVASDSCTYDSAAGTGDDIARHHSATFTLTATTAPAIANRTGTWNVQVSQGPDFSDPSLIKQAASMSPGLTVTAYSFEITSFTLQNGPSTVGAICPAPLGTDPAPGSSYSVVVCGTNHTSSGQVLKKAYSRLGGSLLASHDTFSSASVATGATDVVLGNWSSATTVSGGGSDYALRGHVGAYAGRTSPVTVINGYALQEVPPVANDDPSYSVDENGTLDATSVLANDTDGNGDPLTAHLDSGPAHAASFTLNSDGTFDYTPNLLFHDVDSFTYHVNDGVLDSNSATVTITVNHVNQAPIAVDDSYNTNEDTPLVVNAASGVLSNDSDPDGDPFSVIFINGSTSWIPFSPVSTTQGGSLTPNFDGSFTYSPPSLFSGQDSFTYNADDSSLLSNTATVTINVLHVNHAPVAVDDTATFTQGAVENVTKANGLATDASDIDGDALTFSEGSTLPQHAQQLTINADGSFTYQSAGTYTGTDSFSFKAFDGTVYSNEATVTITIVASGGGGGGGGGCSLPNQKTLAIVC